MAIRISPSHGPSNLSAHKGLLLNPDFGFTDYTCCDKNAWKGSAGAWDLRRIRVARRAHALRVACVLSAVAVGLFVLSVVWP